MFAQDQFMVGVEQDEAIISAMGYTVAPYNTAGAMRCEYIYADGTQCDGGVCVTPHQCSVGRCEKHLRKPRVPNEGALIRVLVAAIRKREIAKAAREVVARERQIKRTLKTAAADAGYVEKHTGKRTAEVVYDYNVRVENGRKRICSEKAKSSGVDVPADTPKAVRSKQSSSSRRSQFAPGSGVESSEYDGALEPKAFWDGCAVYHSDDNAYFGNDHQVVSAEMDVDDPLQIV